MQAGWIELNKQAEGGPKVMRKVGNIHDAVQENVRKFASMDLDGITDAQKAEFKKRKLVTEV